MPGTVVRMSNISRTIGSHTILNNVGLSLKSGTILALIGENGAGKSTLVRVLSGLDSRSTDNIYINECYVTIRTAKDAILNGIASVQQDVELFENFSITENIFSDDLPGRNKKGFFFDIQKYHGQARQILKKLYFDIDPKTKIFQLNYAQKRLVQIAKTLTQNPRVLILDEPTASMSATEQLSFFEVIKDIKKQGTAVLFVSQKINDVLQIADQILIMKDGMITGELDSETINYLQMLKLVSGEIFMNRYPKLSVKKGREILAVDGLRVGDILHDITFSVKTGEILGITGLTGSGKSTLARALFGLNDKTEGQIYIDRLPAKITSPKKAIELGIAFITEDRMDDGLFLELNVLDNAYLFKNMNQFLINPSCQKKNYKGHAEKVKLTPTDYHIMPAYLSGGNQQKLLLLRWFLSNSKIFIMDEPTKNMDIASKTDIYNIFGDILSKNAAILFISSDVEELLGMCDRILILKDGTITAEIDTNQTTYETIYKLL